MAVSRGEIVLAELPFTDGSGSKVRPALVVQNDANNRRLQDVILALITSKTDRATVEATQFLIDVSTPEGEQTGLLHTSAVKCEHLVTLHQRFLKRVIGRLSASEMQQIDGCLKASLGL
ncbi:MAG TPA: type II toxin-antitoxin system PemK/MazF family toxin [Planctomycetaceae bacterium]|nr:type II toxin-antitoxin system PemK/MazF family toxin [Planctomycetaceae bacterium]